MDVKSYSAIGTRHNSQIEYTGRLSSGVPVSNPQAEVVLKGFVAQERACTDTYIVLDNSSQDLDPTPGRVLTKESSVQGKGLKGKTTPTICLEFKKSTSGVSVPTKLDIVSEEGNFEKHLTFRDGTLVDATEHRRTKTGLFGLGVPQNENIKYSVDSKGIVVLNQSSIEEGMMFGGSRSTSSMNPFLDPYCEAALTSNTSNPLNDPYCTNRPS